MNLYLTIILIMIKIIKPEILITIYEIDNSLSKCNTENLTDNTIILNYVTNSSSVNCTKINNSDYGIRFFEENSDNIILTSNCTCDSESLYCIFDNLTQGVTYTVGIPKIIYLDEYIFKSVMIDEKFGFEKYYVDLDISKPIYNIIDYSNSSLNYIYLNFMDQLTENHIPQIENISNCSINKNNNHQLICYPTEKELPTNYQGKEISYNLTITNVCKSKEDYKVNVTVNNSNSPIEYLSIYKLNNEYSDCNYIKKGEKFNLSSFSNIQITEKINDIDFEIYLISKTNENKYYKTLCSFDNILNPFIICTLQEEPDNGIYKISMNQNISYHQMILGKFSLYNEIYTIKKNYFKLSDTQIQYYNYFYQIEPFTLTLNFSDNIENINNFGYLTTNTGKNFHGCELINNGNSVICKFYKSTFPLNEIKYGNKIKYFVYYWNICGYKENTIQIEISNSKINKVNHIYLFILFFLFF